MRKIYVYVNKNNLIKNVQDYILESMLFLCWKKNAINSREDWLKTFFRLFSCKQMRAQVMGEWGKGEDSLEFPLDKAFSFFVELFDPPHC